MNTEELRVGDEVRLSHRNLVYRVVELVGEKVWIKDILGVVGDTVVDVKFLTKTKNSGYV